MSSQSTKQRLLDAIDRAQEAIEDVVQSQNTRDTLKRNRSSKTRDDKAYINVALLEQYMPLCDYLAVGHRPMKESQLEMLIHDNNIRYIFNLRPKDGDKGLWYADFAKGRGVKEVIHIPLETSADKGRTHVENAEISRVASRVVACMRELQTSQQPVRAGVLPTVLIHGYGNAHIAMVVGMVAWYMYRDDNRFDPLQALVERYDESIAAHYPEHWFHRQQVAKICDMERRSVYAALKRAKVNVTRRARQPHTTQSTLYTIFPPKK